MLKPESSERRRVQRVHLLEPLPGRIRGKSVHILDISLRGVRVAHSEALGAVGAETELSFLWEGHTIVLDCRVRRSTVQRIGKASFSRTLYHSGLEVRPSGRSLEGLRELIKAHVERALAEQKANARGVPPGQIGSAAAPPHDFVRHEYVKGAWRQTLTTEPSQPPDGFTIAANHSPVEVQMLRKAYALGDEAARTAIQKIAEMSLIDSEMAGTRRYQP